MQLHYLPNFQLIVLNSTAICMKFCKNQHQSRKITVKRIIRPLVFNQHILYRIFQAYLCIAHHFSLESSALPWHIHRLSLLVYVKRPQHSTPFISLRHRPRLDIKYLRFVCSCILSLLRFVH